MSEHSEKTNIKGPKNYTKRELNYDSAYARRKYQCNWLNNDIDWKEKLHSTKKNIKGLNKNTKRKLNNDNQQKSI